MLRARDISKVLSFKTLFEGISLDLSAGDRLGIIGPNGSGKSTLLRILGGLDSPDRGEIMLDDWPAAAFVPQEDVFQPGFDVHGVALRSAKQGAAARGEEGDEQRDRVTADIVLARVGFPDDMTHRDPVELSGGWRKRLSIASALAFTGDSPDLLVLDEPTNHLDLEGIRWLEDFLIRMTTRAKGAAVFVTHDRDFIERVCTRVAELSRAYPDGLLAVNGNYSAFLRRKGEFLDAQAQHQQNLSNQVRKDLDWLSRGPQGRGTKAKGRIDRSHGRIDELAEVRERSAAADRGGSRVDFNASARKTRKLIEAKGVSKSLGGRKLFEGVDLVLGAGDRLGLLGPNGSGKTTLIRVLAGELEPDAGEVVLAEPRPEVVVFSQLREAFDPEITLRDALCPAGDHVSFRGRSVHVAGWAKRFLFHERQLEQAVGSLSGGELARVHIARIMLQPSDVLVLDEPTNDLDIPTLEVMEESLETYPGALVLVTHDRAMLGRLATEVLSLDGLGGARAFVSLDQALAAFDAAQKTRAEDARLAKPTGPSKPASASRRVKLSYNEQREYDRIESDIERAESEVASAEEAVGRPEVVSDHARMAEACDRLEQAQRTLAELYTRWEFLEQKKAGGSPG
ncbi:MAG: ABC-F family ATP-binding cassette domain-containing protein [Planctomycetota bacterium]